jgi:hypothetical protein
MSGLLDAPKRAPLPFAGCAPFFFDSAGRFKLSYALKRNIQAHGLSEYRDQFYFSLRAQCGNYTHRYVDKRHGFTDGQRNKFRYDARNEWKLNVEALSH